MKVTEIKMLEQISDVTRQDRIRNISKVKNNNKHSREKEKE